MPLFEFCSELVSLFNFVYMGLVGITLSLKTGKFRNFGLV